MQTGQIRQELHKIIDTIEDNRLLEAVHTLLMSSRPSTLAYTTSGDPLTKEDIDELLEASEIAIKEGRITGHQDLKSKVQSWRKK